MRCAVNGCETDNDSKASTISFFAFPSDPKLQKLWIKFCSRDDIFNPKTSVICMEHFRPEDFENRLKYEMGFSKRRLLCRGAVPTIKNQLPQQERVLQEREKRIEKRENQKTVQKLIREYEAESMEESSNLTSGVLEEIEMPFEFFEQNLSPNVKLDKCIAEIQRLRKEVRSLREENSDLKMAKFRLEYRLKIFQRERESSISDRSVNPQFEEPNVYLSSHNRKRKNYEYY